MENRQIAVAAYYTCMSELPEILSEQMIKQKNRKYKFSQTNIACIWNDWEAFELVGVRLEKRKNEHFVVMCFSS